MMNEDHRIRNDALGEHEVSWTPFPTLSYVLAISTAIFGAMHCAAWRAYFPSSSERILWIVASAVSILLPILNLVISMSCNTMVGMNARYFFKCVQEEAKQFAVIDDNNDTSRTTLFMFENRMWGRRDRTLVSCYLHFRYDAALIGGFGRACAGGIL
jgi:hypothetical protein